MTPEEHVYAALRGLASGEVFPDVAPANTSPPYITFQAVGGAPINFVGGDAPAKQPVRMQINGWAKGRIEASALGADIEAALRAATGLQVEVLTGRIATYDEATEYRGVMQDFMLFC